MQIAFLGGASGVGASCVAVEIEGRWLIVDAGVRLTGSADPLPDLAFLADKAVAACIVTHAHADHIGALPLLHQAFPAMPIYASMATGRLMEVMLRDSLKVMAQRAVTELEIPLYDPPLVESMLRRLRVLPAQAITTLDEWPEVRVHTVPAGHVAGAISVGIESRTGRVVISGDVSITPQRTVLPARLPSLQSPDLLILESTYGARLHANRQAEEQRLVSAVAEQITRGHILIPAFALGRAQEVLLILGAAQREGRLPLFPIWVDGLVRTVCATYATIPAALTPGLAAQIRRQRHPFFTDQIRPVPHPTARPPLLAGSPVCFVSSSGMLTGGPSAFYAAALAPQADCAILITGYQDEESPGGRVVALADHGGPLDLGGQAVMMQCRVQKYNLSAHADRGELVGLVQALHPKQVALVHGDPVARAALAEALNHITAVVLPQDGAVLSIRAADRSPAREPAPAGAGADGDVAGSGPAPPALGAGRAFDDAGIAELWEYLVTVGLSGATYSGRELAARWYGPAAGAGEEAAVQQVLEGNQTCFHPVADVPGIYRIVPGRHLPGAAGATARPKLVMIQARVAALLGRAPDLYDWSIDPKTRAVRLAFYFPPIALRRYAVQLETLRRQLGIPVEVMQRPHPGRLLDQARAALPPGTVLAQKPKIQLAQQQVHVRCATPVGDDLLAVAQQQFTAHTGWQLEIEVPAPAAPSAFISTRIFTPPPGTPRLHQMAATERVRAALDPASGCYRVGAQPAQALLVVRFHFPDVARPAYAETLTALAAETGWFIEVDPHPHQGMMEAAARELLPPALATVGRLALHDSLWEAVLVYQPDPSEEGRAATAARDRAVAVAAQAFATRTGWRLVCQPLPPETASGTDLEE